jgi:hypothetical protein
LVWRLIVEEVVTYAPAVVCLSLQSGARGVLIPYVGQIHLSFELDFSGALPEDSIPSSEKLSSRLPLRQARPVGSVSKVSGGCVKTWAGTIAALLLPTVQILASPPTSAYFLPFTTTQLWDDFARSSLNYPTIQLAVSYLRVFHLHHKKVSISIFYLKLSSHLAPSICSVWLPSQSGT